MVIVTFGPDATMLRMWSCSVPISGSLAGLPPAAGQRVLAPIGPFGGLFGGTAEEKARI